jgi:hypothetical protein
MRVLRKRIGARREASATLIENKPTGPSWSRSDIVQGDDRDARAALKMFGGGWHATEPGGDDEEVEASAGGLELGRFR